MSRRCHDGETGCAGVIFYAPSRHPSPLPYSGPHSGGKRKETKASYSLHSRHDIFFRGSKGGGPRGGHRGCSKQPLGLHGTSRGSGWHTLNRSRRGGGGEEDGQRSRQGIACLVGGRERRSGRGEGRESLQRKKLSVILSTSPFSLSPLATDCRSRTQVISPCGRPTHSNFLATLTLFFLCVNLPILYYLILIERDRQTDCLPGLGKRARCGPSETYLFLISLLCAKPGNFFKMLQPELSPCAHRMSATFLTT